VERLTVSATYGGCLFAADPQKTFDKQAIFWSPEALPSVLPLCGIVAPAVSKRYHVDLTGLPGGELRRAPDGWHAIVSLGGAKHRLWLQEVPAGGSLFAVKLQFDSNFDIRSQAAHRFWSALEERPLGPPPVPLPVKRRQRLILAMRALDGWLEGNSYREIAAGLFGRHRIPDLGWKTHDLRNRTIRLVKTGLSMMRGGYRALLRHPSRKK
jgi:hypothetical protein